MSVPRTEVISVGGLSGSALRDALFPAAQSLVAGGLVAFPTETVYGLGAHAGLDEAVAAIFSVKGRPQDNPLIVHLHELRQLELVAWDIPELAFRLFRHFAPGPLTLVLKRRAGLSPRVSSGLDTVAIRFPSHPVAHALLALANVPVVAPSANLSGRPSPTRAEHVLDDLAGSIPYLIDGGPCDIGVESTVLDLTSEQPLLLRPGSITPEEIEKISGQKTLRKNLKTGEAAHSPGMRYRHYAPVGKVMILPCLSIPERIETLAAMIAASEAPLIACLLPEELRGALLSLSGETLRSGKRLWAEFFSDGVRGAARRLYDFFREGDRRGAGLMIVQAFPEEGECLAYMNRLKKASSA